jgi:hypothetical protein
MIVQRYNPAAALISSSALRFDASVQMGASDRLIDVSRRPQIATEHSKSIDLFLNFRGAAEAKTP